MGCIHNTLYDNDLRLIIYIHSYKTLSTRPLIEALASLLLDFCLSLFSFN
jgi:hypothetical protein